MEEAGVVSRLKALYSIVAALISMKIPGSTIKQRSQPNVNLAEKLCTTGVLSKTLKILCNHGTCLDADILRSACNSVNGVLDMLRTPIYTGIKELSDLFDREECLTPFYKLLECVTYSICSRYIELADGVSSLLQDDGTLALSLRGVRYTFCEVERPVLALRRIKIALAKVRRPNALAERHAAFVIPKVLHILNTPENAIALPAFLHELGLVVTLLAPLLPLDSVEPLLQALLRYLSSSESEAIMVLYGILLEDRLFKAVRDEDLIEQCLDSLLAKVKYGGLSVFDDDSGAHTYYVAGLLNRWTIRLQSLN